MPKPPVKEQERKPGDISTRPGTRGARLFRAGLALSILASFLLVAEGIILITRSPLPFQNQFLADWGGYLNLLFGIFTLIGFLCVFLLHRHRKVKTVGAASIGLFSILSFILFGGGFYLGWILGLCGALLTASGD